VGRILAAFALLLFWLPLFGLVFAALFAAAPARLWYRPSSTR
jgi:hypothetical protein